MTILLLLLGMSIGIFLVSSPQNIGAENNEVVLIIVVVDNRSRNKIDAHRIIREDCCDND